MSSKLLEEGEMPANKAMQRVSQITDNILKRTPELVKDIPQDSVLLKGYKSNLASSQTQLPTLKKGGNSSIKDPKKKITSLASGIPNEKMSSVDWQQKAESLSDALAQEKDRNMLLNQEMEIRQQRFVKREAEYRNIIAELEEQVRSKFSLNTLDTNMNGLRKTHAEIIDSLSNIQLKTSKVLLDQEKDIIRFFNNKIQEIKRQFEEEKIKEGKKNKDYQAKEEQLIAELEWIKNIAQKIDDENHNLQEKFSKLKAQYSTQENDREILLREVILKKKKNAILKSQIDQYEKIIQEVSKDEPNADTLLEDLNEKSGQRSPQKSANVSRNIRDEIAIEDSQISEKRLRIQDSVQFNRNEISQMKYESSVQKLKGILAKERKKVQHLKTLYIRELESKSIFEQILRKCIEDIKDDILNLQKHKFGRKPNYEYLNRGERSNLIEKLINDERILTLIYDKTFYGSNKKIEIPPELLRDDDDDDIKDLL